MRKDFVYYEVHFLDQAISSVKPSSSWMERTVPVHSRHFQSTEYVTYMNYEKSSILAVTEF